MDQDVVSKEQFLEVLRGWLEQAAAESAANSESNGRDVMPADALPERTPRMISVSIGKEGRPEHIVDVAMYAKVATGYELGFEGNIADETELWPELVREAKSGIFDEGLFLNMVDFAFEKLVAGAEGDTVSRRDAYLARAIKEFADVEADISEEFAAAQLVAEALSAQACGGWQRIDGEIPTDKLVVFKGDKKVLVDMAPVNMAPLLG